MISDPKNLTEQLQNLSERIAIEMRALNRTKVSKINGAIPDSNGEVTIANATTSASGLMSASDKTKLGGIAEGANNYSLPTASSSQLGGVKTGSNITNTSGTISLSKTNVTNALGYTPLQTAPVTSVDGKTGAVDLSATYQPKGNYLTSAPVTSVNGQTGDVTVDVGVTSFNGSKGAVTYTAPVTSVNGKTGAVTIDTGVTSFNGKTGAVTYSAPVSSVNGQTGAVSIDVGVKTVNNVAPDASGNVTIEVSGGGGSGDGIPKTGDRGLLGGYNNCPVITDFEGPVEVTIDENSPDDMTIEAFANGVTLNIVSNTQVAYVKNVLIYGDPSLVTVNFGDNVFVDTFFSNFVNDLGLSTINQVVVTNYVMDEGDGPYPMTFVSNKVIM